jgi:FAD:protein FMN transferase
MANLVSETRLMWGMPITVAIVEHAPQAERAAVRADTSSGGAAGAGEAASSKDLIARVYDYFAYIDDTFSTYKPDSEISRINDGRLALDDASTDMRAVFALAEGLRQETDGYFNITRDGMTDPSGLVKGWAVSNAATTLRGAGCDDFYVEAGGDFQAEGLNAEGRPWRVGIRNPFITGEIVKVLSISGQGVATSGTYIRGPHIYNPVTGGLPGREIVSITVIGPDVYEADCYATAAFAMGRQGIKFIEALPGFEGYMIDINKQATFTSGFDRYVDHENNR